MLADAPTSDAGFIASGATLDECFRSAADATLAIMLENPASLETRAVRHVRVNSEALDMLLVRVLEELLYFKDADSLFLRATEVHVAQSATGWEAAIDLAGEAIDPTRHQLSGDVKAITLHRLAVEQTADGWQATVVVDV